MKSVGDSLSMKSLMCCMNGLVCMRESMRVSLKSFQKREIGDLAYMYKRQVFLKPVFCSFIKTCAFSESDTVLNTRFIAINRIEALEELTF